LVKQDKSQRSLYWTSTYAKEHSLGEGRQTTQERASGAETTSIGIQDCYWSQAGRSKNQGSESHQKQWWIQEGNEGTSRRNEQNDETDDGDVSKTSPNLVAHHLACFISIISISL